MIADLNHDGKPDIIALASRAPELVWYENPTWERHVIAGGFSRMINCAVVDAGGQLQIVLASSFENEAKDSVGIVSVLKQQPDPRALWSVTEIDRIPTSHRLRTANIFGTGKKVVINAPLTGAKATAPDFRDRTPLVFYQPGMWKREYISQENQGIVHGISVLDWAGDGRDEILTAGFEGIYIFKLGKNNKWTRTEIAKGDPAPWPRSGSSDIAVGHLKAERFIAAIEPWHGNQVSVYRLHEKRWQREVIDTTLVNGHTIQTADLNGNGSDQIIAGYRGQGHSVYVYSFAAGKWTRQTLDNDMAAAACAVADLNSDGRIDIACIGSSTGNLKWYENLKP